MSLINKMLQDLDERHAAQGGLNARTEGLTQHVRPVAARQMLSDYFWRVMAVLMLVSVGWVAWLVWQLSPRPLVTELAYDSAKKSAPPAAPAAPEAAPVPAQPRDEAAPARTAARGGGSFDMLRLATEMTTPIPDRAAREPSRAPARARPAAVQARAPAPPPAAEGPAVEPGKIERRANVTTAERAESEFRRAVALVNQGRIAEGMDGLRNALKINPAHENARQTLVSLLIEARRVDDAAAALQEGLSLNPDNSGFAMLLARILVERNDAAGALGVLQKHAAPGAGNADFHAFAAALYQRLDRHREAIEEYRAALRLAPSAGIWWVGLGISHQAAGQPKEALEAFNAAKSAGSLAPDLLAFVDQRLKQLQ